MFVTAGEWSCVATTSWGLDTIHYTVAVKQARLSCSDQAPPSITSITGQYSAIQYGTADEKYDLALGITE